MTDRLLFAAPLAVLLGLCVLLWWRQRRRVRILARELAALQDVESQLRRLELQLRRRADTAPSTLWDWQVGTPHLNLAEEFLTLTGYSRAESGNRLRDLLMLVHPDDRMRLRAIFEDYLEKRTPDCETEFRLRCADGRYLWILTRAVAVWREDGTAERMLGSLTDITSRVEAEEQMNRLFNLSIDMLAVVGFDQNIQQLNPAWVRVLGWSRDDLMARRLEEFATDEDRPEVARAFGQLAQGRPLEGFECRFVCRDGSWRWLAFTAFPYPDRQTVFAVARDITAQKEATSQRAVYQERLRQLRNQLAVVEDRQRQELASAIHDGVAQQLFGLRAQLTLLKYPERLSDYLAVVQTALDILDETMVEARALSFELFPPVLYQGGLDDALRWLAHNYSERTGQSCTFVAEGSGPELPQDTRAMLYQCMRELLNNVRKHATAQRVDAVLRRGEDYLEIAVADDGSGFVPPAPEELAADEEGGFGLFSIRERVASVGGEVVIESAPGAGTRVTLRVPVPARLLRATGD
jgi:PAS domain S-box-containing protein